MKGAHAFRNTMNYLQQGKVVFKHNIKIMTINYNIGHHKTQINTSDTSKGMRFDTDNSNNIFKKLAFAYLRNPY